MRPARKQIKTRELMIIAATLMAILLVLVGILIALENGEYHEEPGNTVQTNSTNNTYSTDSTENTENTEIGTTTGPWEQPGAKQPEDYTWEEFLNLPPELQIIFQNAFGADDAFEAWLNRVQPTQPERTEYPWEQSGAKQPENYTWEEFLQLSSDLQIAFQNAFGSADAFGAWLNRVQPTEPGQSGYPWEQPGATQPEDYTWEEFLALLPELQIAFQNAFNSADAFEAWMNRAQSTEPEQAGYPWEQPGAKQPKDYTWEEFVDLSPELQIAFQNAFSSADAFEAWLNRAQSTEPEQIEYPWEQSGAKQPEDYTWEEFLTLSPELQIAFQNAFSSDEALEEWMNREMPRP